MIVLKLSQTFFCCHNANIGSTDTGGVSVSVSVSGCYPKPARATDNAVV